ncbi:hypothetical protein [Candidatus Stoquefichus massiliensis]|uniref:hypothetical protein n=1 Tax=Candidatus Stoquefichus massiliensis TaxID=1470350 RepID=UPI00047F339D|nr:hypothetical protein [Candidatus Stoquefichus massiliensis]
MEKSKLHQFIFTVSMALVMVYAMICYNVALNIGGMSNQVFVLALHELMIMWPIAIVLELFFVEKLAVSLAMKKVDLTRDSEQHVKLTICTMIVCIMCPIMSLVATLLFKNVGTEIIAIWIETTVFNFPMALGWQIFFGGAFLRKIESFFIRQIS